MTFHETLVLAGFGVLLVAILVAVLMSGGRIRRRVAVVGKDKRIRSEWVKDKHINWENGHPWYVFRKAKYDWAGPWYEFEYRLVRSFGARKYIGTQRIYLEGNPTPYRFDPEEKLDALDNTAWDLYVESESDLPNRLLRPRRVDYVLIVIIAVAMLAVGFIMGGQFSGGGPDGLTP